MKKNILVLFYWILIPFFLQAQVEADTVPAQKQDSPVIKRTPVPKPVDSVVKTTDSLTLLRDTTVKAFDSTAIIAENKAIFNSVQKFQDALASHPYFKFFGKPIELYMQERKVNGNEIFFYALMALLFYYALIRIIFYKYLSNIFTLFFRATLRQQQIREQLLQTPLPSLLLNILFILSAGVYSALLATHYHLLPSTDFWLLCLYCIGGLLVVYIGKYLVLKTLGWILRISKATDTYLFIVFMVNKITGIILLPVLLLLAFPHPAFVQVVITLSLFVLAIMLGYRFLLSYRSIRTEIRVNPLHFFLYLCAFEIAPLLLIYKVLLSFVERTN